MNYYLKEHKAIALPLLGSVLLYVLFAHHLERSDFLYLLLLYSGLFYCAWRLIKIAEINFWILAGIGVLFRVLFLPAIPNLSQDFYRFLWDGRVLIQGINPYVFTPDQFLQNTPPKYILQHWSIIQWDSLFIPQASTLMDGMGALNASHYSNYPPVNQFFFTIAALFFSKSIAGSVVVLKVLMVVADIGILYFGKKLLEKLKLPVKNIFWYFLNPFIIIELTGNLHFEGIMLFFVVWAFYLLQKGKWFWGAVLLGISISVKLLPLLFLPLFFKWFYKKERSTFFNITSSLKFYIVVVSTVLLTFAPFLSQEFIINFSATIGLWFQKFEFNASVYYIIRWIGFQVIGWNIIATVGKVLPLVVILFILAMTFFRNNTATQNLITATLFCVSFYFLLSTTVHPWYVATPLVLSIFTRYRFPIVWSFMVVFSYAAYGADGFQENLGLVAMEYSVVIVFALYEIMYKKTAPVFST